MCRVCTAASETTLHIACASERDGLTGSTTLSCVDPGCQHGRVLYACAVIYSILGRCQLKPLTKLANALHRESRREYDPDPCLLSNHKANRLHVVCTSRASRRNSCMVEVKKRIEQRGSGPSLAVAAVAARCASAIGQLWQPAVR